MKIGVRGSTTNSRPLAPGHSVAEDVGRSRVEHPVALLLPGIEQRLEAWSSEAHLGIEVPFVASSPPVAARRAVKYQRSSLTVLCRKWRLRQVLVKASA